MPAVPKHRTRNIAEKRLRILQAAQVLFTEKGYSQTSIADIARRAEVAVGLVNLHFGKKLNLFERSLVGALAHTPFSMEPREDFGLRMAKTLYGKEARVFSPAMLMLSIEDEAARKVAIKVMRENVIGTTVKWLGGDSATDRAVYLTALSLSLSLLRYLFDGDMTMTPESRSVQWIARGIQEAVNGMPYQEISAPNGEGKICANSSGLVLRKKRTRR